MLCLFLPRKWQFVACYPERIGFLSVYFRFVRSSKKIIYGYVKIIRKHYKRLIIRLALAVFIAAYAVLIHIQVHRKLQLRYSPLFPQFQKTHTITSKNPLDNIIPKRYNIIIPVWYNHIVSIQKVLFIFPCSNSLFTIFRKYDII